MDEKRGKSILRLLLRNSNFTYLLLTLLERICNGKLCNRSVNFRLVEIDEILSQLFFECNRACKNCRKSSSKIFLAQTSLSVEPQKISLTGDSPGHRHVISPPSLITSLISTNETHFFDRHSNESRLLDESHLKRVSCRCLNETIFIESRWIGLPETLSDP